MQSYTAVDALSTVDAQADAQWGLSSLKKKLKKAAKKAKKKAAKYGGKLKNKVTGSAGDLVKKAQKKADEKGLNVDIQGVIDENPDMVK